MTKRTCFNRKNNEEHKSYPVQMDDFSAKRQKQAPPSTVRNTLTQQNRIFSRASTGAAAFMRRSFPIPPSAGPHVCPPVIHSLIGSSSSKANVKNVKLTILFVFCPICLFHLRSRLALPLYTIHGQAAFCYTAKRFELIFYKTK